MAGNLDRRAFLAGSALLAIGASPLSSASAGPGEVLTKVGVCGDLWRASRTEIDRVVQAVRNSNLKFVRWDISWRAAEVAKDKFIVPANWDYLVDSVADAGAQCIGILCYGNPLYDNGDKPTSEEAQGAFARYALEIAAHFRGRIKHYEVWNEWDTKNGNTSYQPIDRYIDLLKRCYPILKNVDSEIVVMAGNFSEYTLSRYFSLSFRKNYLHDFLSSDAGDHMDCFSIHPYVRGLPRERTLTAVDQFFGDLKKAIQSSLSFRDKPIFVTEMGWQTGVGYPAAVDEETQSQLLLGAVQLAHKHGFEGFCIFKIKDGRNDGYGLHNVDWRPKLAASLSWN